MMKKTNGNALNVETFNMTKQEKRKFINNYLKEMKDSFINKLNVIPENWDGIELRHWIAKEFERENLFIRQFPKRKKKCNQEILIYNL